MSRSQGPSVDRHPPLVAVPRTVHTGLGDLHKVDADGLLWLLRFMACVLILKVTVGVVLNYRDYLPPDFRSDFLRGRESYFWNGYQWPFYAHIASGPVTLVLGMILLSDRFRLRFAGWHRRLGRIQAAGVLLVVAPSGLWMAFHSATGPIAGAGFASLAVATGLCMGLGWRAAVRGRFAEHRRWMGRCYVLLCSAVVLRLMAGVFTVTSVHAEWSYPVSAWTSWLVPLGVFELFQRRSRSGSIRDAPQVRALRGLT